MSRTETASTIVNQSFYVLGRHRKLLVFPLLAAIGMFGIIEFFLAPLVYHTTTAEMLGFTWPPVDATGSARGSGHPMRIPEFGSAAFGWYAATYLIMMFGATFINFAFYSQVIQALNGGRVSVRRGFELALARLPAIVVWALFAGTIGVALRMIQERLPLLGRWAVGLLGMAGSVASVFIIPVMLNEPRTTNPLRNLRTSAGLIKRVWGEGLIGVVRIGAGMVAVFIVLMLIGMVAVAMQQYWLFNLLLVLSFGVMALGNSVNGIFNCGLYIYATEGVAPGPFDADTLNRAWTVKDRPLQS